MERWSRQGGGVTTTTDSSEGPSVLAAALTRADSADRTLIAEQVMRERYRGLRNLLAYVEDGVERDPETVVLRTDERTAQRVVGHDAERTRFGFDGQTYEVRAE